LTNVLAYSDEGKKGFITSSATGCQNQRFVELCIQIDNGI
jgi:hypothetical protein